MDDDTLGMANIISGEIEKNNGDSQALDQVAVRSAGVYSQTQTKTTPAVFSKDIKKGNRVLGRRRPQRSA